MGRRAKRKSIAAIEKKILEREVEEDDALGDLMTLGMTAVGAKLLYDGLKDTPVEDIEIPKGTEWVEEGSTAAGTKWEGESFTPPPSARERIAEKDAMVEEGGRKSLDLAMGQHEEYEEAFWENQEKLAEGRKQKHAQAKEKARLTEENIAATSAKRKAGRDESLKQAMAEASGDRAAEAKALKEAREYEEDPSKHVQQWKKWQKETGGTGHGPGRIKEFQAYEKERIRTQESIAENRKRARQGAGKSLNLAMEQDQPVREAAQDKTRTERASERQLKQQEIDIVGKGRTRRQRGFSREEEAQSDLKRRTDLGRKKRKEIRDRYKTPPGQSEYKPRRSYQTPYPTARGRQVERYRSSGAPVEEDRGLLGRLTARLGFGG